jgi:hypothetical protein
MDTFYFVIRRSNQGGGSIGYNGQLRTIDSVAKLMQYFKHAFERLRVIQL